MEAGYDHLLLRSQWQYRFFRASAFSLLIVGAFLLSAGIAYYVYSYKAHADLDKLNVAIPSALDEFPLGFNAALNSSSSAPSLPNEDLTFQDLEEGIQLIGAASDQLTDQAPHLSASAISSQQLYPGETIKSSFWGDPLEYEPVSQVQSALIQGFKPVLLGEAAPLGSLASPTKVMIPSLGVDSTVSALKLRNLGDSRAYETPKNVVGHIPTSANPGESGSIWLFGHLESPIAREGSVFYDLPKIPGLLSKGQDVYAVVENGTRSYLYRITESFVVHQNDMQINYGFLKELKPQYAHLEPGSPNLHLVTCVPRLTYDHRLVVSGVLVGQR